jgi:PAS domain-containing protein
MMLDIAYLAAIVESSSDAIIGKDLEGTITVWNAAAATLFGYLKDEIVGRSITTLIPSDRQTEESGIIERVKRGELIRDFQTVRLRKEALGSGCQSRSRPLRMPPAVLSAPQQQCARSANESERRNGRGT